MIYKTHSPLETRKLAAEILGKLNTKNTICLYGNLGSGKTTFVQGLAKALGVMKRVISPTFILVREYEVSSFQSPVSSKEGKNWQLANPRPELGSKAGGWRHLIHADCYRLNSEDDIKSIDLPEIWSDPTNLVVIEWAEKIATLLPKGRIDIKFEYIDKNTRNIMVNG